MIYLILVFTFLTICQTIAVEVPSIRCPQYFQYLRLGSTYLGKITLPNVVPGTTTVYVQFSQRQNIVTPNYYGNLALYDDKQTTINKLYSGQPILYRVDFPTPNVLPKLTLIQVNDKVLCSDAPYPLPSLILRLMHRMSAADLGGSLMPYQIPTQSVNSVAQQPPQQSRSSPATQQTFRNTGQQPQQPQQPQRQQQQQRPSTTVQTYAECGLENRVITPYIVGGELLSPKQFPWLAAIFASNGANLKLICGGTLVSTSTVVTAAHCFVNTGSGVVVQLGRYDLEDYSEVFETRSVRQIIRHPDFRLASLPDADIALLHLNAPVSTSIRPACLWNEQIDVNLLIGQRAAVAGWGEDESRKVQSKPKRANADVVSSSECQRALRDNLVTPTARAICVRSSDDSTPCRGDSGGGLVVFRNGRWILRGIVSGGNSNDRGCLLDYTFFCDLAQHRTWLYRNII